MSRRVLVTGAGSGLGREIACAFAADGARVLVTDVDGAAAEAVAAELGAEHLKLDVTDDASWESAREWCEQAWGGLDVLVNNAGVARGGRFELISMDDWQWITEINLMGVVRGCRTFVPMLKAQGSGHLVNVASLAGIMNLPAMSSYNASKAAVISLSETLHAELRPYGVRTSVVCPAFFKTNLLDRLRSPDPVVGAVTQKLMASSDVTATDVGRQVFEAVRDNRFMVLTHADARRSARMKRLAPKLVERQVAKYWERLRAKLDG